MRHIHISRSTITAIISAGAAFGYVKLHHITDTGTALITGAILGFATTVVLITSRYTYRIIRYRIRVANTYATARPTRYLTKPQIIALWMWALAVPRTPYISPNADVYQAVQAVRQRHQDCT